MGIILFFILYTVITVVIYAITLPFPLNDKGVVRYNTTPWITLLLILINTLVYMLWQFGDLYNYMQAIGTLDEGQAMAQYVEKTWIYGFRASYLENNSSIGAFTSFTSMFMHADLSHLIGNMVFLWAFGRRVEDACGPWRYLLFYMFAGMVATMGYALLTDPSLELPGIGASGAVSGILGAYLILFPGAKVTCLWFPAMLIRNGFVLLQRMFTDEEGELKWTVQLPAIVVLVLYVLNNLLPTFQTVETGELAGGVNYVAHMTGFLSALAIFLFVRKDLLTRYFAGRSL